MISTQQQGQQTRQNNSADGKSKYAPRTGIFQASVAAINPNTSQIKELLGKDVSWDIAYTGTTNEGEKKVNIDIWLQELKSKEFYRLRFSIVDKPRLSEKGNQQWVNTAGKLTWGVTREEVMQTERNADFITRDFRNATVGEENLFEFLSMWLLQGKKAVNSELVINPDMAAMFNGDFSELQSLIPNYTNNTVVALATISENGEKQYQNVWKQVLPGFLYDKVISGTEDTGMIGRWKQTISGAYGVKDKYELVPLTSTEQPQAPSNVTYNAYGQNPKGLGTTDYAATAAAKDAQNQLPF